ncbi:glycosyl hydrolase family 95 catalytic domain-containing protein [Pedobacter sp. ASV12]|uniref:glycosyl hydrolase family 95 catalytic domain-containing protein n=1 Tax=Pedobacter sp. ASV12 TaxID=2795120 RepID=UPI0018EAF53C|nr:glycoside hydrolase N-terminal domain-containing protein [Pedobacter sp. ASV12]
MKALLIKKIACLGLLCGVLQVAWAQNETKHNLVFNKLANKWDEAMPLGNGMLGALVWQKGDKLRLSLDRADLWDERKALDMSKLNFKWVKEQVLKKDYRPVQKIGDEPYDNVPYPTKLPAAAIEFDISALGKVKSNVLSIKEALNTIKFENGTVFNCYIHATKPEGYFSFENLKSAAILPQLMVHNYNTSANGTNDNSHAGQGLGKLGYAKGTVKQTANSIVYHQPTADGHYFEVLIKWQQQPGHKIIGSWTISSNKPAVMANLSTQVKEPTGWDTHLAWWKNYWKQSSVSLPDTLLEKQYYLELYKLGCVSRKGAPAITLQAIWTADNGSLPPWKGDFHNDLNTQLSYWPAYTGNRLVEAATFTDWLWKIRDKNLAYTKQYFGVEGLNVPGVVTLNGDPMGGWIQYSMSPTVSAWASQHFYWQWKYSMDKTFLKTRAYPYIHDAATYLENITYVENGVRKLPLSSSPEYNDNSINAWFLNWSNFDLGLSKFLFKVAAEVSQANGQAAESQHWLSILKQLPDFEVNETGFTVAPGQNLNSSHRHFSQYMAIYPLALLDVNRGEDKLRISNSLKRIEEKGTRGWCGYSFSWMASLYARAYEADKAVKQLQIFANNFCSPNSFHLNGDQKGGQYSGFTYRPFTLEGNFAFAQGVNELLLQSREGYIEVFPAVPRDWKNASFENLRAEGAFLVSAQKQNGVPAKVSIKAEKGGLLAIKLPFKIAVVKEIDAKRVKFGQDGLARVSLNKGESISFENGYE